MMPKDAKKPPNKPPSDIPTMEVPAQETMRRAMVAAYFAQMQAMNVEIVDALRDAAIPPHSEGA